MKISIALEAQKQTLQCVVYFCVHKKCNVWLPREIFCHVPRYMTSLGLFCPLHCDIMQSRQKEYVHIETKEATRCFYYFPCLARVEKKAIFLRHHLMNNCSGLAWKWHPLKAKVFSPIPFFCYTILARLVLATSRSSVRRTLGSSLWH